MEGVKLVEFPVPQILGQLVRPYFGPDFPTVRLPPGTTCYEALTAMAKATTDEPTPIGVRMTKRTPERTAYL